jgi:hypothetical protein
MQRIIAAVVALLCSIFSGSTLAAATDYGTLIHSGSRHVLADGFPENAQLVQKLGKCEYKSPTKTEFGTFGYRCFIWKGNGEEWKTIHHSLQPAGVAALYKRGNSNQPWTLVQAYRTEGELGAVRWVRDDGRQNVNIASATAPAIGDGYGAITGSKTGIPCGKSHRHRECVDEYKRNHGGVAGNNNTPRDSRDIIGGIRTAKDAGGIVRDIFGIGAIRGR